MIEDEELAQDRTKVCVVLGAGASWDAWNEGGPSKNIQWQPPLASELFGFGRRPTFLEAAAPYPGVQVLASELGELGPRGIIKMYFRQVPLYLRDLLLKVTGGFTTSGSNPGNHVRLCLGLLKHHRVAFLDLNYDDYLERALPVCDPDLAFHDLLDYVKPGRQAIVGKVHGSIHWGTPIAVPPKADSAENLLPVYCGYDPLRECSELIFQPSRKFTFNWRERDTGRLLYPILTAPLAGKNHTALVCPKGHLRELAAFLKDCENFLVIGTSGQDDDLLGFLRSTVSSVQGIHYVNWKGGTETCKANVERECRAFVNAQNRVVFDDGFRAYLNSEHFQNFLRI